MFIRCYARASTSQQDATRAKQTLIDFVKKRGHQVAAFYIENRSGASLERPELIRLLDESSPGDAMLVESIDRLTRLKPKDWETLKSAINQKGISIISLDLPTSHLVFGTFPSDEFMSSILKAINHMLLDILAASSYKEYRERERKQKEGITKAKQKNKYQGRPANSKNHENIERLSDKGFSINEISEIVDVSRSTVIRVRRRLALSKEKPS